MSIFFADLHIHSRFSRATSKNLTLRNIAAWALLKGLDVVATGDFTHPGWFKEIENQLEQKDDGLLALKEEYKKDLAREIEWWDEDRFLEKEVYFILSCEISSIYKKYKRVRRIHNVVFFPSIDSVKRFNKYLSKIGNLKSDGRPILGFDSEDLLKLVLDTDPNGFLIPAHIWTPWFSLFGANSGFDSIEECFGSLSNEVFALETGLSSDPEMNWLWSKLDRFALVSNSDAHSGEKLAREANMFSGEPSYFLIYRSLKEKTKEFLGTIEFFPEEGKYHLDGHRKCKVVLEPKEAIKLKNICPVCKQPLTIGVLHRIITLADREKPIKPKDHPDFLSFIPLCEILTEILGGNIKSKPVLNLYKRLIKRFGSELFILKDLPIEELKSISIWLAEAIKRMREKKVYSKAGFDGQYGQIFLFTPEERKEIKKGKKLIDIKQKRFFTKSFYTISEERQKDINSLTEFNPGQKRAITFLSNPLLVIAGPGTGKTKTLIGRIKYLLEFESPDNILIITFSRAASREIKERIKQDLKFTKTPKIDTLHAVAFEALSRFYQKKPVVLSEEDTKNLFKEANPSLSQRELSLFWNTIIKTREQAIPLENELKEYFKRYTMLKRKFNVVDYQDLLEKWLEILNNQPVHYKHVLVDEVQDLSRLQLKIIKQVLESKGLFAIGDPNQSIYSFRGAMVNIKEEFLKMWPDLKIISLDQNYRSKQNILDFSAPIFNTYLRSSFKPEEKGKIVFFTSQTQYQEAIWISKRVKELIGATAHHEVDMGHRGNLSPSDIGILFRFKALIPLYKKVLEEHGIPTFVIEENSFWEDPRIELILSEAERVCGINENSEKILEDEVVKEGPLAIAKAYETHQPFDKTFWKSKKFLTLSRLYQDMNGWEGVLSCINMEKDFVQISEKSQKVFLITIHASKGLEFEAVFIPAMEAGILPFKKELFFTKEDFEPCRLEEEKRLLYVALTRAKTYLFISCAKKRTLFNKEFLLPPSPFIKILPMEMAKKIQTRQKKKKKENRLKLI